jgi:myosin-1
MSLQKDELVELVQKDDNGWWLVKKDGTEGWAPNNYLELVPPKAAPAAPPPPPRSRPIPTPMAPIPKVLASSVAADASARPVSVFPGMAPANGSVTPWKKSGTSETPASARVPPPVASKPRPAPPVAAKPSSPKPPVGGKPAPAKPPIPAAARPTPVPSNKQKSVGQPAIVGGQLDLAAAVSTKFLIPTESVHNLCLIFSFPAGEASTTWSRWLICSSKRHHSDDQIVCSVKLGSSCSNVNFEWIQYKLHEILNNA